MTGDFTQSISVAGDTIGVHDAGTRRWLTFYASGYLSARRQPIGFDGEAKLNHKLFATIVLTAQAAATAYVAIVVYLLSVWMVEDSLAFRMDDMAWLTAASKRVVAGVGFAAVLAGLLWAINLFFLPKLGVERTWSVRIAVLAFGVVALMAIIGGVQFLIERPHL